MYVFVWTKYGSHMWVTERLKSLFFHLGAQLPLWASHVFALPPRCYLWILHLSSVSCLILKACWCVRETVRLTERQYRPTNKEILGTTSSLSISALRQTICWQTMMKDWSTDNYSTCCLGPRTQHSPPCSFLVFAVCFRSSNMVRLDSFVSL